MDRTLITQVPVLNFRDFIAADGDLLRTDSIKVAAVHSKKHYNVLQSIYALFASEESKDFAGLNFQASDYYDATGRKLPMYLMTKDGYTMLAMAFTGSRAVKFKIAYINAFNAMALYIKNQRDGLRYRCMEKELECKDSARRGSFHGRGLNLRKQEKPVLESELAHLLDQAQRPLNLKAPE
jgi:Rha family phage regulatory protein